MNQKSIAMGYIRHNCWLTFLIILVLLFYEPGYCQSLRFEHYTTDHGLSQNQVFFIFQDSRDFIWISTSSGLNRYDGNAFKIYRSTPDDPTTVHGSTYKSIIEDKDNNLWIASNGGGLSKYVRNSDSFIRYPSDLKNPNSVLSDRINALLIDRNGFLWIGTEAGLSRMNMKTGKFNHFGVDVNNRDCLCEKRIYSLLEDSEGKIWVGTWKGLSVYDPSNKKFINYISDSKNTSIPSSDLIFKVYEDREKNIWICTIKGLYLFNKKNNSFKKYLADSQNPFSLSDNTVMSILEDKDGRIWIATNYGGLNLFDKRTEKFYHFRNNPNDNYSLSNNSLLSIMEDRSGLIWIGTNGSGLNKLNYRTTQFKHYRNNPSNQNSLSHNSVSSFLVDKNNTIWIGTISGGLNKMVRKGKQSIFTHYENDLANPNSISGGQIFSISVDRDNNLWIGTESGLNKFIQKENRFKRYNPTSHPSMVHRSVFSTLVDKDNNVWIGEYNGGICILDQKQDKFINYIHSDKDQSTISSNTIRHLFEDSKRRLWIATEDGLNYFDRQKNRFIHFKNNPANPESIIDNFVLLVFEDSQGNIWVGTPYGLSKMYNEKENLNDAKFIRYTVKDGLPGVNIQGIEEDNRGNLWISTNNGISKFNLKENTFRNFSVSDGLQGKEFYVNANKKIINTGELVFGGDNGFNIFHPDSIQEDSYDPPIRFTEFYLSNVPVPINKEIDGQIILEKSITETNELNLSYKHNDISFEYATLYAANSGQTKYRYMLEGLDTNWKDAGNRRFISFVNLPAGDYTLRVIGCNNAGVWNSKGASLNIHISPPFWGTWYFRTIIVLTIIFSLVIAHKFKTRAIEKRSKELQLEVERQTSELRHAKDMAESANKFKSDFLANISHELRTPLNAIMGYAQLLRKHTNLSDQQKDQLFTIQKSGEHLLTLINDILEFRRIEVKGEEIIYREFNLHSLIADVLSTISVKALEKSLEFTYEENKLIPKTVVGDAKKIKQILINLLGNAIKYTNTGSVKLEVEVNDVKEISGKGKKGIIKFIVSDTGIGIAKEIANEIFQPFGPGERSRINVEGSGLGLAISKKISELIGGKLYFTSQEGVGSTFFFEIEVEIIEKDIYDEKDDSEFVAGYEGEKKCLMVVDDNLTNRVMLTSFFEPLGFKVIMAESGREAFDKLIIETPDLILLDLLMPVMDGIKFLDEFKGISAYSKIKVIGISAAADKERMETFYKKCDDFISKPVHLPLLLNKISVLLGIKLIKTDETPSPVKHKKYSNDISLPEDFILNKIVDALSLGNYSGIEKIVQEIENNNQSLKPFCDKIRQYTQVYDDESIVNLCRKNNHV